MIGILAILPLLIIGAVTAAASLGFSIYQYKDAKDQAKKMEGRNEAAMKKKEAQAEVLNRKEFNRAAQQYAASTVVTQKELSDEKRKQVANYRNFGRPVD